MNQTKELFTQQLKKGKRSYFFDIKKTEDGVLYLKISESKVVNGEFKHHTIMIFDEDMKDFVDSLNITINEYKKLQNQIKDSSKGYSLEDKRTEHKQAYQPWSADDDERLELLFCENKSIKELSIIFERNEGAISSRIKKLDLKAKYS